MSGSKRYALLGADDNGGHLTYNITAREVRECKKWNKDESGLNPDVEYYFFENAQMALNEARGLCPDIDWRLYPTEGTGAVMEYVVCSDGEMHGFQYVEEINKHRGQIEFTENPLNSLKTLSTLGVLTGGKRCVLRCFSTSFTTPAEFQ